MQNINLNEKSFYLYAAKHYYNPLGADHDEFIEDLKRFKYIKRLINRYVETDVLAERLILNHMIVLYNVFGTEATVEMLKLRIEKEQWCIIKPFLIFLNMINNTQFSGVIMDPNVVEKLRAI